MPESQSKMDGGTYRLTDKDGRKWQHESEGVSECDQDDYWFPVENGKALIDRNKAIIDEELRNRLPEDRKPATSYFPDPSEAHADALAMLLFDRKMLYARNPKLYELMKVLDQNDINRRFGFQKSEGRMQPLMIRNLEGKIVPNHSSQRALLKEAERQWAAADLTSLKEDPPDEADEHASCSCHKTQASRKNKARPKN